MTAAGRVLAATLIAPLALAALAFAVMRGRFAMEVPPRLPAEARVAIVAALRRALEGRPAEPVAPVLAAPLAGGGPLVASVWLAGQRVVRVEGRGATLGEATAAAAAALAAQATPAQRAGRLMVDVVMARGRLATSLPFSLLSVDPGRDGVGVGLGDGEVLLGADELMHRSLLDSKPALRSAPDIKVGLDLDGARSALAERAGRSLPPGPLFRFRADSFIEGAGGAVLPLERGLPPAPAVTAASLRAGALAAARYLAANLDPGGHFIYELDLSTGRGSDGARYSLPRHAGAATFLAQVVAATHDPELRRADERALDELVRRTQKGAFADGTPYTCVVDSPGGVAQMGSTALAAIAFAEYHLATGDARYDATLRELLAWVMAMARPDGGFTHYFVTRDGRRLPTRALYYDGEAALALVRGARALGDHGYLAAAERALDYLVSWTDSFAGKFFFGEDHWTCIAADAAWPDLRHDRYRAYCSGFGAFLRRMQFSATDPGGFEGAYGVTPFLLPRNTPVGSRTEAMISAYALSRDHGRPEEQTRRQIIAALGYLLRQQIGPDNDFWVKAATGAGAIPGSTVDPVVRIDYPQHSGSAMLRAAELLGEGAAP